MSFQVTSPRPSNHSDTTRYLMVPEIKPSLRGHFGMPRLGGHSPSSLRIALNVTLRLNSRVHILRGRTPVLHFRGCTSILKKIKNKIQNVAGHGAAFVSVSREHVSRTRFGLARVRACDKVAHDPTLITIDYKRVDIYTTQSLLAYPT